MRCALLAAARCWRCCGRRRRRRRPSSLQRQPGQQGAADRSTARRARWRSGDTAQGVQGAVSVGRPGGGRDRRQAASRCASATRRSASAAAARGGARQQHRADRRQRRPLHHRGRDQRPGRAVHGRHRRHHRRHGRRPTPSASGLDYRNGQRGLRQHRQRHGAGATASSSASVRIGDVEVYNVDAVGAAGAHALRAAGQQLPDAASRCGATTTVMTARASAADPAPRRPVAAPTARNRTVVLKRPVRAASAAGDDRWT